MTVKDDLTLIERVIRGAAQGTVKHHEVSLALQALERLGRSCPKCGQLIPTWAATHEGCTDIGPRGTVWQCGRCAQLHEGVLGTWDAKDAVIGTTGNVVS